MQVLDHRNWDWDRALAAVEECRARILVALDRGNTGRPNYLASRERFVDILADSSVNSGADINGHRQEWADPSTGCASGGG
jgi:hypothetical protein